MAGTIGIAAAIALSVLPGLRTESLKWGVAKFCNAPCFLLFQPLRHPSSPRTLAGGAPAARAGISGELKAGEVFPYARTRRAGIYVPFLQLFITKEEGNKNTFHSGKSMLYWEHKENKREKGLTEWNFWSGWSSMAPN